MDKLPSEIIEDIAKRAGEDSFSDLRGLLLSGRVGRDAVTSQRVLKNVNLRRFTDDTSLVLPSRSHRDFFIKCVNMKNPVALYLEGLRLACRVGDWKRALRLFEEAEAECDEAHFACGVFFIGIDEYDQGVMTFNELWDKVTCLHYATQLGETILQHLESMGAPTLNFFYERTIKYPSPPCLCSGLQVCPDCLVYWNSLRICSHC